MKKLSIHSDGFGSGTVIIDEDGRQLEGVVDATIWLEAREPNRVDLTIMVPSINVTVHVEGVTLVCPLCKADQEHECEPNTLSGVLPE